MNNNEILESVKLNEKGKKTALVLVLAASLLAAIAAFFGFLGGRKSQKSGIKRTSKIGAGKRANARRISDKRAVSETKHAQSVSRRSRAVQEEKTAEETEAAAPIVVQQPVAAPQPVYVVRPVPEKKRESKAKRFVRRMCVSVAAILVLSVLYSDMIQYVTPPQLMAKESFSGIGRVVSEHTDTPYVILNIVPYAENKNAATMGYLSGGQQIATELKEDLEDHYRYDDRVSAAESVLNAAPVNVIYEERYEGIDNISGSDWIQLFSAQPQTSIPVAVADDMGDDSEAMLSTYADSAIDSDVPTGQFFAMGEYNKGSGNFKLVKGVGAFAEAQTSLNNGEYVPAANGLYQVAFGRTEGGGYKVSDALPLSEDYLSSWVYRNEGDVWVWTGMTIADLLADYDFPTETQSTPDTQDNTQNTSGTPDTQDTQTPEVMEPTPEVTEPATEVSLDVSKNTSVLGRWYKLAEGDDQDNSNENQGGDPEPEPEPEPIPDPDPTPTPDPNPDDQNPDEPDESEDPDADNQNPDESEDPDADELEDPDDPLKPDNGKGGNKPTESSGTQPSGWDGDKLKYLMNQGYAVVIFEPADDGQYGVVGEPYIGDTTNAADTYDMIGTGAQSDSAPISANSRILMSANEEVSVFEYVGEGGDWNLTRINQDSIALSDNPTGMVEVRGVGVSFRIRGNEDQLKKYVFSTVSGGDNENRDFEIHVEVKYAGEVNPDDIFEADLIYIEDGDGTSNEEDHDISDEVVSAVLYRATQDLMPIIVDNKVTAGSYFGRDNGESGYSLLARAMLKKDLEEFYIAVSQGTGDTLVANLEMGVGDNKYRDKTDNAYHYVNRNIYIVGENVELADGLATPFDEGATTRGFSEVLAAIKAENTLLSDDNKISETVTPAKAIQYIINYSVGIVGEFDDLTILELQPTANRTSDLKIETNGTYTKLLWKTDAMTAAKQILSSKKEFGLYQTIKSVAEFNGEWEDINSTYDIVFIGLDGQRLYRDNDADRTARYNNSSLNGKVYHLGDDSGAGRYDANDITAQKMTDLLNYMEAGYPVLVENNCFKNESAQKAGDGDVNDKYIDRDSVMYRFLNTAVTDERYKDYIFTVSDAMASPLFMTQVRISRPRINVFGENDGEAAKVQSLMPDENGDYHGTIAYSITDNRGDAYYNDTVIHLYADYNYDGIFAPEEEVGEYSNNGGMIEVVASDMGPGILPWKLEVTDAGNAYRRDSEQGYFVLGASSAGELKVLQITEQTNDDRVSLQRIYNNKDDSLLAYYLRGAANSTNSEFIFETVNAAQLEEELGKNAKYLEQWDVVVMTLDGGAASQVVNDAVTSYAEAGRSLLVCAQGLEDDINSGINRLGLSAGLLGQRESDLTYTALGASGAAQYLRYSGLSRDMFGRQVLLQAETVNEGSISYYPYQLGNSTLAFGERGWLRPPTYLLDFDNNLSSESNATYVTAWYTFGSGSEESQFGISPRDARNNYYCYSKGNVVYLAQSEYPYTYNSQDIASANGEGADESKLFVNALMAAYSAGVHNANVHIVAGFAADSADVESIPVPFDQDWLEASALDGSDGMLDNTVDVYFRFRDSNMARNKTVQIEFLREEPSGADLLGIGVNMVTFSSEIWAVRDGRLTLVEPDQLVPGQTYRIEAPVVNMQNNSDKNKADIYVVIRTTFMRGGKECSVTSYDKVSLNRAELRPLE